MLSPEQYSRKTAVVSESDVSKAVVEALLGLPSDIFHRSPTTGLLCLSHFGSHVGIAGASCGAVGAVLRHFAALASDLLVLRAFASASSPAAASGLSSGSGGGVALALRAWVLELLGSVDRELSSLDSDIYGSSSGVSQPGAEMGEERERESRLGPAPASHARLRACRPRAPLRPTRMSAAGPGPPQPCRPGSVRACSVQADAPHASARLPPLLPPPLP